MAYMTDENGNYKRTVTCGHCYEKGHNKSSCKSMRQRLRERIASNKGGTRSGQVEHRMGEAIGGEQPRTRFARASQAGKQG